MIGCQPRALVKRPGNKYVEPTEAERPVAGRDAGNGRGLRGVEGGRIKVVRDANARSYASLGASDIARIRETLAPLHARLRARAGA